jgi:hypothetical protein
LFSQSKQSSFPGSPSGPRLPQLRFLSIPERVFIFSSFSVLKVRVNTAELPEKQKNQMCCLYHNRQTGDCQVMIYLSFRSPVLDLSRQECYHSFVLERTTENEVNRMHGLCSLLETSSYRRTGNGRKCRFFIGNFTVVNQERRTS